MSNEHVPAPLTSHEGGGYEKSDLSVKAILIFGVILAVLIVGSLAAMGWMFGFFASEEAKRDVPPSPLATTRSATPEPRLQVAAVRDMKTLRAAEDAILTTYGWASKETGAARIPIDRAMQLLLERGLPTATNTAGVARTTTAGGPR